MHPAQSKSWHVVEVNVSVRRFGVGVRVGVGAYASNQSCSLHPWGFFACARARVCVCGCVFACVRVRACERVCVGVPGCVDACSDVVCERCCQWGDGGYNAAVVASPMVAIKDCEDQVGR